MTLEQIIESGTRRPDWSLTGVSNIVKCVDGFRVSVIAGPGAYCVPRPDFGVNLAPYTAVEVGFPSERPEPWAEWEQFCEDPSEPTETVYGYVPVDLLRALVESHGGEA